MARAGCKRCHGRECHHLTRKDKAERARQIMLEKSISQPPIVDRQGWPGGYINGRSLLRKVIKEKMVDEVMEWDRFPLVTRDTRMLFVISILREEDASSG